MRLNIPLGKNSVTIMVGRIKSVDDVRQIVVNRAKEYELGLAVARKGKHRVYSFHSWSGFARAVYEGLLGRGLFWVKDEINDEHCR